MVPHLCTEWAALLIESTHKNTSMTALYHHVPGPSLVGRNKLKILTRRELRSRRVWNNWVVKTSLLKDIMNEMRAV